MLASLELLSEKNGQLNIGFKNGTLENSRAEGNILGTYGQSHPIRGKKRDFLGLTKKDLDTILDKYPIDDKLERQERTQTVLASEDFNLDQQE